MKILDLGIREYGEVYEMQRALVEKKRADPKESDTLIFVEHPEVYTYGRKSKDAPEFMAQPSFLIERGGEATYHNPGQLVVYPILTLGEGERDLHRYLRNLEEVLIRLLAAYQIEGERREGATGVWIRGQSRKIASIGVAVKGWVTYHGVALNVANDLKGFSKISPCGFAADVMTSLQKEGASTATMASVKLHFLSCFAAVFGESKPFAT